MDTGEGRHDLLNSLCLMSLTFVAFFFPLTYFFTRCWYALLSRQVCKGVVNSCDVMFSFTVMFYDQLCRPASSGQDNRESHIVRKKNLRRLQAHLVKRNPLISSHHSGLDCWMPRFSISQNRFKELLISSNT